VSKTTFYNHFESKEDLIVQVMKWRDQWLRDTVRPLLRERAGDSPRAQLLALFDLLDEVFGSSGFSGCIFIRASGLYTMPHDPVNLVTAQHKRRVVASIREVAAYAGALDPGAFADEMAIVIAGAYALSQMDRSMHVAGVAKRLGKELIDRHIPQTRARVRRRRLHETARAIEL
jgi:AcrR family transcriptional regulator